MKVLRIIAAVLLFVALFLAAYSVFYYQNMYYVQDTADSINPVYPKGINQYGVKDACLVYKDGIYYIFASAFYENEGRIRTHLLGVSTSDFVSYSEPFLNRYGSELDVIGICSPQISYHEGVYYMIYNSWGDKKGMPNQLYYATSINLVEWDMDKPLARNITEGKRSIDGAVHFMNGKVYLVYKEYQVTKFAVADTISGHFRPIKSKLHAWYENYCFIQANNNLYMMATDRLHNPAILSLQGDQIQDDDFGCWKLEKRFKLPMQGFNTNERANAASITYIAEQQRFLMIYAGRTENKTNLGRGNNQLGIAQSDNLLEGWEIL